MTKKTENNANICAYLIHFVYETLNETNHKLINAFWNTINMKSVYPRKKQVFNFMQLISNYCLIQKSEN